MWSGRKTIFTSVWVLLLIMIIYLSFYNIKDSIIVYRAINKESLCIPIGYEIKAVAKGLNFPTAITFDSSGNLYIAESGIKGTKARVCRIEPDGSLRVVASDFTAPITDITWFNNKIYVSHKGRISTIDRDWKVKDIIVGLPSFGDYSNTAIVFDRDGTMYFGQGTATNSGIVGIDNYNNGWLKTNPYFHDYPSFDVVLDGKNYGSESPFNKGSYLQTGAFSAYGVKTDKGQLVKAAAMPNGVIYRADCDGKNLNIYASGLRHPVSLAINDGKLYAIEQAIEDRGSRPVKGDRDDLYELKYGAWYGWPDFAGGEPIGGTQSQQLILNHPTEAPPKPLLQFEKGFKAWSVDFNDKDIFGYKGNAFVAVTGKKTEDSKIIMIDMNELTSYNFVYNNGGNGEDEKGLIAPVDVKFSHDGCMYIVDKGKDEIPRSGVLWKVYKKDNMKNSILPEAISEKLIILLILIAALALIYKLVKK